MCYPIPALQESGHPRRPGNGFPIHRQYGVALFEPGGGSGRQGAVFSVHGGEGHHLDSLRVKHDAHGLSSQPHRGESLHLPDCFQGNKAQQSVGPLLRPGPLVSAHPSRLRLGTEQQPRRRRISRFCPLGQGPKGRHGRREIPEKQQGAEPRCNGFPDPLLHGYSMAPKGRSYTLRGASWPAGCHCYRWTFRRRAAAPKL